MVCCNSQCVETVCACDLCGLDMACGDRAYAQTEPDGTESWVCDECWRDITDHYADAEVDAYAYADLAYADLE